MITHFFDHVKARKKSFLQLFFAYTSNALSSALGLAVVLILGNFLTQNEYGNYKYIYSMVGILGGLSLSGGFRTVIIQSVAKGYDGILELLAGKNIPLNLPMAIGGIVVGVYYIINENIILGTAIPLLTIATIYANNGLFASAYLNGRSLFRELLFFQTTVGVANVLALLVAVSFTNNVIVIIACGSLSICLVSILGFRYVKKRYTRSKEIHGQITSYTKHHNFLNILSTVQQHIDSIIIFGTLGSASLALYAMATPFVDRLLGFVKASYFVVLPKFMAWGPENAYNRIYIRTGICFLIGILIWFLYTLTAPFLFEFLFPQYSDSVPLTILAALNIPLAAAILVPQAYVDSLIEIKNKYILYSILLTVRLTTLPLGIYLYGIEGVIYSELIMRFFGLVFFLFVAWKTQQKTN